MKKLQILCICLTWLTVQPLLAQNLFEKSVEGNVDNLPIREHTITISKQKVNLAGKEVMGMTINGGIPGPTLNFTEGEYAVIYVKNEMEEETSVHWHGLLLPNFYDGVPYLNTPPIAPGETQKYEFPIKQSGTYWYHSHTMLQEQSGVYGSIVIQPKEQKKSYDQELVMLLSDWTNEKPMNVLRNLKRGNEWYNVKKGTATPLNQVISRGALGAQMNFWKQRMESADIADVYYPAFLINGKNSHEYNEYKPGEKVRLRIINGAASTQFWMTFGGGNPTLISADGLDVVPVKKNKSFIAIAETYDFEVTIPESGKIEFLITAQDGSGNASAYLGTGDVLAAPSIPRPDKIGMMKQMASMDMRMGAPALKFRPKKDNPHELMNNWGMQMDMDKEKHSMTNPSSNGHADHMQMDDHSMAKTPSISHGDHMQMENMAPDSTSMDSMLMDKREKSMGDMEMGAMNMFAKYNYDDLKSPEKSSYDKNLPVKEILLNLTGNMNRYIWSMNGIPLSETDNIKINEGEVTRITFNNLTMMHHPMHLHGHFFRVINKNGDYSPLKHTVNVPPMQKVTIEFYGNEYGDWIFHCHVLYHMMGGMARVMSYGTPPDKRMKPYPVSKLIHETNKFYSWGTLDLGSHMGGLNLTTSNIRNQFNLGVEYGWNQNLEAEFTYEYYLYDYFRIFGGVNIENSTRNSLENINPTAIVGVRWFSPYMFDVDFRIDNEFRPRLGIGRSVMLFPKFSIFGYYEYQFEAKRKNNPENKITYSQEIVWNTGAQYLLSRNFSLTASYDNRFGAGGGLSIRF